MSDSLQDNQDALRPVAERLDREAGEPGSTLAGVRLDAEKNTLHVYTTDANALQIAGETPADAEVEVHPAAFTRNAMIAAADRITGDARQLGERLRISVASVGPAVDGSGITVSVLARGKNPAALVERATQVLRERYGDIVAKVVVTEEKASEKDLFFSGFRFNDYAPWYGGDRIATSSGGCTSGFDATFNGVPVMLTAAHCGGVGTQFYNGPRDNGTYNAIGASVYSHVDTDIGAIQVASTTKYINVGSALSPSQRYIGSWGTPIVGSRVCQSGSYTGEVCNLLVVDNYQTKCRAWFLWWCTAWYSPVADAVNLAGSNAPAAGHGDSGGPVYLPTSSGGVAMGLVHGPLADNAAANYPAYSPVTVWCNSPEGWSQRCSSGFSFAHMPGY